MRQILTSYKAQVANRLHFHPMTPGKLREIATKFKFYLILQVKRPQNVALFQANFQFSPIRLYPAYLLKSWKWNNNFLSPTFSEAPLNVSGRNLEITLKLPENLIYLQFPSNLLGTYYMLFLALFSCFCSFVNFFCLICWPRPYITNWEDLQKASREECLERPSLELKA